MLEISTRESFEAPRKAIFSAPRDARKLKIDRRAQHRAVTARGYVRYTARRALSKVPYSWATNAVPNILINATHASNLADGDEALMLGRRTLNASGSKAHC
jgi:hypothetical protein